MGDNWASARKDAKAKVAATANVAKRLRLDIAFFSLVNFHFLINFDAFYHWYTSQALQYLRKSLTRQWLNSVDMGYAGDGSDIAEAGLGQALHFQQELTAGKRNTLIKRYDDSLCLRRRYPGVRRYY